MCKFLANIFAFGLIFSVTGYSAQITHNDMEIEKITTVDEVFNSLNEPKGSDFYKEKRPVQSKILDYVHVPKFRLGIASSIKDSIVREKVFSKESTFGKSLPEMAEQGQIFARTSGIIWRDSFDLMEDKSMYRQNKPIMVTATFVRPESFGISDRSLENRLLVTCAHFMPECRELLDSTHFYANSDNFFKVGKTKFSLLFSFQDQNFGRFGHSGMAVKHIFLHDNSTLKESNYVDIALLVLEDRAADAKPVEYSPIIKVDGKERGQFSNFTAFGLGAGIPCFETPELKHETSSIQLPSLSKDHSVQSISNKNEINKYDNLIKAKGWQILKRREFKNEAIINSTYDSPVDNFMATLWIENSPVILGPGDSGGPIISEEGKCVGVTSTGKTATMLTIEGLKHFGNLLKLISS